MKCRRTLPPAAAPIGLVDILQGIMALTRGKKERDEFGGGLRRYFGVNHCFLVSSGKAALYCILKALQKLHPDRDEVLVPAFNCYSVPSAVLAAGLKIRLCDVDPNTLDFDPTGLSKALLDNRRLLCVVPTHLFGLPANVRVLRGMLHDNAIAVIEDAAQAMGSVHDGARLGLMGDVGFFSLGRGKALSTYEGGIIVTDNDVLGVAIGEVVAGLPEYSAFQIVRLIFNALAITALSHPMLFWIPKGLPFLKLGETLFEHTFSICVVSPFQAGLAWNWEKKLNGLSDQRKARADRWAAYFQNNPFPGVSSFIRDGERPNLLRFPLRVIDAEKREKLLQKSEERGLGISETYPLSLDALPELLSHVSTPCPNARACAATLLTLPIHCFVSGNDEKNIKAAILETFR
jgi:dTDP-4-amino-4,6-dideoxygalactose transaminase